MLFFGRNKKDDPFLFGDRRYLTHEKVNGARLAASLECWVEPITVREGIVEIATSRVVLGEENPDIDASNIA